MTHYLKNALFFLIILMMPYMNFASKAMGPEDDEPRSSVHRTKKENTDDVANAASFSKHSNPVQPANLEDAQTSLVSYLSSPLKASLGKVSEVINNNKGLIIGGLVLFCRVTVVGATIADELARCACYCSNNGPKFYGTCAADMNECTYDCSKLGFPAASCIPGDKGC